VKAGAVQSGSVHPAIRCWNRVSPWRVAAPCGYERSGCGRGADPVLRSARPACCWLTGHLPARRDYGCSPVRSTACRMCRTAEAHRGTRRPNDNLVGLERFRAADHHARTNPALPDGPLTRTRSGYIPAESRMAIRPRQARPELPIRASGSGSGRDTPVRVISEPGQQPGGHPGAGVWRDGVPGGSCRHLVRPSTL
jgi:hypothetical protein